MTCCHYIFLIFLGSFFTICCGSTNLNENLFVSDSDKQRVDGLLIQAQAYHDQQRYENSLGALEKALEFSPNNEKAIQLKAFNELALAGYSVFDMIKKISASFTQTSGTSDTLNKLATALGVSADSYTELTTLDDGGSNSILQQYPVYIPSAPGNYDSPNAPRNVINTLKYLNQAIHTVCPLIDEELRKTDGVLTGSRYTCTTTFTGSKEASAQAYFVFFLGHLAETIIFNITLLSNPASTSLMIAETSTSQTSSNIFKRIDALQRQISSGVTLENLGEITEATTKIIENTAQIFDTSPGSLLSELMNNLRKSVDTFKYIEGMPSSITENLSTALDSILDAVESVGGATNTLASQTSALKDQLGGVIVSGLTDQVNSLIDKINTLESAGSLTAAEQAQLAEAKTNAKDMCSSLESFVEGTSLSAPSSCSTL